MTDHRNGRVIPDIARVDAIIRETAAHEIMPRFRHLGAGDITKKHQGEIVTVADIAAEKSLGAAFLGLEPRSAVIGEEATGDNPGLLALLDGPQPCWVIDPIDGTRNFADGRDCFAVIVAYCQGGRTLAGWIYDPIAEETAWAVAGEGAWIGQTRIRARPEGPLQDMTGSLGGKWAERLKRMRRQGEKAPKKIVRYRCVGREYMDLAAGRLDFARYGTNLKPWDHAAGVLMHGEAGGYAALEQSRQAYRPTGGPGNERLLLAPGKAAWLGLHGMLEAI